MADVALDYGSADVDSTAPVAMQDDAMVDEASAPAPAQGSRFYALPTDQAVEAGAQRGPAPLTGAEQSLDDAALMGVEEPSETPDPPAVETGSDVRLDTLLIQGLPITQLSTSRLFAYLTHFGAQPLGLEWIDDQRCKVVFADERSARLGLEYLCPAPSSPDEMQPAEHEPTPLPNIDALIEYDPESWHSEYIISLVLPRKAHRIPAKLYNHVERQAALTEQQERQRAAEAVSSLPDDVPEIYREMEEADRKAKLETREVRDLKKLRSALWLRHAVTDVDRKESRASTRSQWYKRHGYEAGREIVPKLLQVGELRESVELFPDYVPSAEAHDRPQRRNARGRDDGTSSMMDQLDSELDRHVAARDELGQEPERGPGEMMADAVQARRSHHRRDHADLMDRLSSRDGRGAGGRRRNNESSSAADGARWGHDAYDQLAASADDPSPSHPHRRGRRSRPDRSNTLDAMDEELDELRRSRHHQHQRELSPGRRPRHTPDAGRLKVKGRGRMKAPGLSSFDDRWNNPESTTHSLADRLTQAPASELRARLGSQSLADRFS